MMMRSMLFNISLGLAWVALTGEFTPANLLSGIVLGYFILLILHRALMPGSSEYFSRIVQIPYFVGFFVWQLVLANIRVAWEVMTPGYKMRPGIIGIPLDLKTDLGVTVLANLITLTPGTISLDVARTITWDDETKKDVERRILYVHSMYVEDIEEFRESIKQGFEKRVKELFE